MNAHLSLTLTYTYNHQAYLNMFGLAVDHLHLSVFRGKTGRGDYQGLINKLR
jgi:hypothetical protein